LTYRPTGGEDIYGNKVDSNSGDAAKPTKYIPPHLRKKLEKPIMTHKPTTKQTIESLSLQQQTPKH